MANSNPSGKSWVKTRQTKFAAYTTVYVLIVVAVVCVLNFLADRYNKSYDTTSNKQFTLSDQTYKMARDLKQDVTITYWDQPQRFTAAHDILDRYKNLSPKIDVRYEDAEKNRTKAIAAGVKTLGTIFIDIADKHQEAKALSEEELTGAMVRALKGGERMACFVLGSGEHSLDDAEAGGFSGVKQLVESNNYKTQTVKLLETRAIPKDCMIVVVAGPVHDYLQPEVDALKSFIESGGRGLFMMDPPLKFSKKTTDDNQALTDVIASWGVTLDKDLVLDTSGLGQIFQMGPEVPLVTSYGQHAIVRTMKDVPTGFPITRSLEVKKTEKSSPEKLFDSIDSSFATTNLSSSDVQETAKDKKGPLTLAAAGTYNSGSKEGTAAGRFVVLGSSSWAANSFLRFNGNRDLFMNIMNWMSSDEDLISIRPKDPDDRRLNMSRSQMALVFYSSVIVIPLFVVLGGLACGGGGDNSMNASRMLIALVLLAGLGGAVWWSNKQEKAKEGKPPADTGPKILSIPADTVQEIDITRKSGEHTALKKSSDGKWTITLPKPLPADETAVAGITAAVSTLNAERLLDDHATEWASYGLEPAVVTAEFKTKDGKSTKLLMGEHSPSGSSIYARLDGDPRLFTMSAFTKPEIDKVSRDLRDKRMLTFVQEKLSQVEISGPKNGMEFSKAGGAEWRITKPKPLRIDSSQIDDLINKLRGASMDSSASLDTIKDQTEGYHTSPLVATVKVTDAAGTQTLEVRKWKDDYYAKSSVIDEVNKVSKDLGAALEKTADDYRNKRLFDFGFNDLSHVEMTDGGKTTAIEKKGEKWTSAAGKEMDSTSVQAFIDRLRDLAAGKFLDTGFTKPAVTLTVVWSGGKRTEKVELSQAAGADGSFVARRQGEAALYELDSVTVKDLRQAVGDVREAQPEKKK